jgi:LmbE family N-acetylglucosaminyl deacetylase
MVITLSTVLTVLVVIAHPDDESLFGGFVHALTHKLNATVDLVCVTNGEGGFAHAGLSESFYGNLKLTEEAVGRKHLPRIRQQELLGSGRILGIRRFFFYDQMDLKYSRDVDTVLTEQWDKEWVIDQFQRTLKHGNGAGGYDLMVILLPSVDSHGHHTASALLALEAIDRLQQVKTTDIIIPTVIGGSEFVLTQPPTYPGNRLADVLTNVTTFEFRFNLRWKMSNSPVVDYQTVLFWMAAEHKTQGGLVNELMTEYNRDNEQYYYFAINERYGNHARLPMVQHLFIQLADLHQDDLKNVLHDSNTIFN